MNEDIYTSGLYQILGDTSGYTKEDLSKLSEAKQIDLMLYWFGEHFEDPVERTPYISAEGGYQWIHGGPYDALEELESEFGEHIPFETIEKAAFEIQSDGTYEWTSSLDSSDYDDDFAKPNIEAPSKNEYKNLAFNEEQSRKELIIRIEELEAMIAPILQAPIGMGHNNPPSKIDELPFNRIEWQEMKDDISSLSEHAKNETLTKTYVEEKSSKILDYAKVISIWIGKRLEKGLDTFIATIVKIGAAAIVINVQDVLDLLNSIASAAGQWLNSATLLF